MTAAFCLWYDGCMRLPHFLSQAIEKVRMNKVIRVLIISDFFIWSGFGLLGPVFAVFITQQIRGGELEVIGFASSIYLICKSVLQIPIARFLDMRKGEHDDFWAMLIGSAGMSVIPFLYLGITQPWELYAIEAFYGIGAALAYTSWEAIFTRHVDKDDVALEWSMYNTVTDVGGAATASIGGLVAQSFGFHALFLATGIVMCLGTGLLLTVARTFKIEHDMIRS